MGGVNIKVKGWSDEFKNVKFEISRSNNSLSKFVCPIPSFLKFRHFAWAGSVSTSMGGLTNLVMQKLRLAAQLTLGPGLSFP